VARAAKKRSAEDLAHKDAELQFAKRQHEEQLSAINENTLRSLEQSASLHAKEMKLTQYISITQRVFELDHLFIEKAELRKYFYDDRLVDPADKNLQTITSIGEYILDFYSTLQEQEVHLTDAGPEWEQWNNYIEDGFRRSPYLCFYFEQQIAWYEDGLTEIYRNVARDRQEVIRQQRSAFAANKTEMPSD